MRRAGEELGGYVVARWLGSGGMGSVYEAIDADGRHVALKLLHPHLGADPVARDRLRREVQTLQRVRHVGVARVLDAEADSDEAFVVTELIDGVTLDSRVRESGPLGREALADLARGLHAALSAIHAVGVVHRDVKPANVMLTADGPVLIDFGISQILDADRYTQTGLVTGTPGYIDPRVTAGGPPGRDADWWSWAAVLAFAAVGRPPYGRGPQHTTLGRAVAGDVDLAGLEPDLARAFTAALSPTGRRLAPGDLIAVVERDPAGEAALAGLADAAPGTAVPAAPGHVTTVVPRPGSEPTVVVPAPAAPAEPPARTRVLGALPASPVPLPPVPPPPVAVPPPPVQRTPLARSSAPATPARGTSPGGPTPYTGAARPSGYAPGSSSASFPLRTSPSIGAPAVPQYPAGTVAGWSSPAPPNVAPVPTSASSHYPAPTAYPGPAPNAGDTGRPGAPWAGPPPYASPAVVDALAGSRGRAPARSLLLLAILVVAGSLSASWPGPVLVGVFGLMVVAGAVGSGARMTRGRREGRGRRGSDVTVAWLLAPWHLLRAAAVCVLAVLAGALAGGTAWLVTWALITGEPLSPVTVDGQVQAAVTAGAVVLAIGAAWVVPTSGLLREGARETLAALLPTRGARALLLLVCLAVALVAAVPAILGLTTPDWSPLPSPLP